MLFLVPSEMAKTSLEAREKAAKIMATGGIKDIVDSDFYDSFYVGGAWTGTLTTQLLDQEKLQTFDDEVKKIYQWPVERSVVYLKDSSRIEKQKMTLEVFLKYFPNFEGEPPFFRNESVNMGYDDDALFISNERQYYKLLSNYEGRWFFSSEYQMINMFNLSRSIVTPENIIDKHWVVVLTCHR
ncbi:MAG: hypothetical protein K0U24_03355 [Gammaproteobacteria bacterium]|nr:hypothetical protein [Gammaproteobacteria bacterium]